MRVSTSKASRRSKKRWIKRAKGNFGRRKNIIRTVKETVVRSRAYAFRDRRVRKREFRRLWITRISAACAERGLRYSTFMHGLKLAGIDLNRKTLSELAIFEPAVFDELADICKSAQAEHVG
ncbi:MAG: 50S ribosomal protein L20 [Planctomycetota bacterium]|nr:MAG: 50S ribosomal protein L20 [Planctomycetota bacterium]REJ91975.1 MAG: 50S ribosomal protein L20 [Planctomycetota bacterium]REK27238.1 MAG: 50S ribosomal protein L20 [Planctomycetota bacterium]REK36740.1 MAG: 50S ribosomal protein L20 [Planctomycetota bacterium]